MMATAARMMIKKIMTDQSFFFFEGVQHPLLQSQF
jgi:hypothetical protein